MFVTDNVYSLDAASGAHAYALRSSEGVVLVDTSFGGKADQIAAELDAHDLGGVAGILLTHHDVDHIGNAAALQRRYQCDVYVSAVDMPYVTGMAKRPGIKKLIGALAHPAVPDRLKPLPDGDIWGIQIIPTPGHTPGHVCFLFDGVLFAGDLLNSRGGTVQRSQPLMTWDMGKVDESVRLVNGLDFRWVCPGHGGAVKTSHIS